MHPAEEGQLPTHAAAHDAPPALKMLGVSFRRGACQRLSDFSSGGGTDIASALACFIDPAR
jgi:hypothetical protein